MLHLRFSLIMNTSSRSVGKGRTKGKAKKTTTQLELVNAVKRAFSSHRYGGTTPTRTSSIQFHESSRNLFPLAAGDGY